MSEDSAEWEQTVRQILGLRTCPACSPRVTKVPDKPVVGSFITCPHCRSFWKKVESRHGPSTAVRNAPKTSMRANKPVQRRTEPQLPTTIRPSPDAPFTLPDQVFTSPATRRAEPEPLPDQVFTSPATRRAEPEPRTAQRETRLSSGPAFAPTVIFRKPEVFSVVEESREEEFIRVDRRSADNTQSSANSATAFEVSYQEEITFTTSVEAARVVGGGASVSFVGGVQGKVESALREKYDLTQKKQLSEKQTTTVNVPARTKVIVEIHWKRVWAIGVIRVRDGKTNAVATIPFRSKIKIVFDTRTLDVV